MTRIFVGCMMIQVLMTSVAHAGFFQGANQVRPKEFTAGAFGLIAFSPSAVQATAQAVYGINSKFQAEARLSVGQMPTSLEGYVKHHFFSSDLVQMAVLAGVRIQSGLGLRTGLILSHTFSKFELYGGPLADLLIASGKSQFGLGFIPGVSIPISNKMRFYGEAVLSLATYYNGVAGGVRFYF